MLALLRHGPLTRYAKFRVAHAQGMPGTFSPPPRVSDPGMHHGTCVTHVTWCLPGSLTCGFLWSRWRENVPGIPGAQFCVSGKRPIPLLLTSNPWMAWCQLYSWEGIKACAVVIKTNRTIPRVLEPAAKPLGFLMQIQIQPYKYTWWTRWLIWCFAGRQFLESMHYTFKWSESLM